MCRSCLWLCLRCINAMRSCWGVRVTQWAGWVKSAKLFQQGRLKRAPFSNASRKARPMEPTCTGEGEKQSNVRWSTKSTNAHTAYRFEALALEWAVGLVEWSVSSEGFGYLGETYFWGIITRRNWKRMVFYYEISSYRYKWLASFSMKDPVQARTNYKHESFLSR